MKILQYEPSGRGGMYAYTDAIAHGLSSHGEHVTILTTSAWPNSDAPYEVAKLLKSFENVRSSKIVWMIDRFSKSVNNCRVRNKFVVHSQFDLVHLQMVTPFVDQFFLRSLTKKCPVVLTVHDVKPHCDKFNSRRSFLQKCFLLPQRLIVHHQDGKRQLVEDWAIPSERIDVIPHGIMPLKGTFSQDECREKAGLPKDRKILLFFGGIRENKGLDVLLEALPGVIRHEPDALLLIAGGLPRTVTFDKYEAMMAAMNLDRYVEKQIRFIEDSEVDMFFAASDIVVLPYKKFESQSGVLLRAYAHKKPVVVSHVGAMGELVSEDKTGRTVPSQTPDLLADAIVEVLSRQSFYQSHYTQQLEDKYHWHRIAELTINSYRRLLS